MTGAASSAIPFINGRMVTPQGVVEGPFCIIVSNGRIARIEADFAAPSHSSVFDLGGGWLSPGLIDIQINGGGGVLFNDDPTPDGLTSIGRAHLAHGVTGFMPTLVSASLDVIAHGLDAVDAAIEAGDQQVLGIHIEGPFINSHRRGIHTPERIRTLDDAAMDLLTRPRRGKILVTLAPELCTPEQIAILVRSGVTVCLGHSDATASQAQSAFHAGARGVTHLFNAMSPLHHRAPGLVGAALDQADVWCGVIADGVHVDPIALRLAFRIKGPDRLILVSDAMPPIGSDMTEFTIDGRRILVRDGHYVGEDGALAGADLTLDIAMRGAVQMMGASVPQAVEMAAASPAAFLGLEGLGALSPGCRADLLWLDTDLKPRGLWQAGRPIF